MTVQWRWENETSTLTNVHTNEVFIADAREWTVLCIKNKYVYGYLMLIYECSLINIRQMGQTQKYEIDVQLLSGVGIFFYFMVSFRPILFASPFAF